MRTVFMFIFNIGGLLHKHQGSKVDFDINAVLKLDPQDGVVLTEPVKGHVQILKLPHELNVQIKNLHTEAKCECARCLESFTCTVDVPLVSREFIIDLQERDIGENEEVDYIEKNRNEIDLGPMVREEILLHFPIIPLCFEGCKGLCDKCGINLNSKTCSCPRDTEVRLTPFKLP